MRHYVALLHKDPDSDFGVSFPDFPGCVTAGRDLDEARALAGEALALHIRGLVEDGDPLPEPSSLEAILEEAENRRAVAFLVEAPTAPVRSVRVNITIPEDTLRAIDRYAADRGLTRSGFLARAARRALDDAA
jgi:predicted RNase H-like HicB family nuclease